MLKRFTVLRAVLLPLAASCLAGPALAQGDARLTAYATRLAAFGFSGQILVAAGDRVLFRASYGFGDRARGHRITDTTPLPIGSLSKPFTSAAILALMDAGRLLLDDPIARHLPNVPDDKRAIAIHQLLTHSSGLARDALVPSETTSRTDAVREILGRPLRHPPGADVRYSNAGYQLLAALVENAAGIPFDEYLATGVLEPAGLKNTVTYQRADRSTAVTAYNEWTDLGSWTAWAEGWGYRGNGSLLSTVNDLHRWWRRLRGGQLLSDSATRLMFAAHGARDTDRSYGYGWEVGVRSEGDTVVGHGGDIAGFHAEFRWHAPDDLLVIVLTNLSLYDDSGTSLGLHGRIIARNLVRIVRGESVDTVPRESPVHAAPLARYAGTWVLPTGGRYVTWTDSTGLRIGAEGQDAIDLLLPADSARARNRAAANRRSESILRALSTGDTSAFREVLSPDQVRLFSPIWQEEWSGWARRLGPFARFTVLGSVRLPWGRDLHRTGARLEFARGTVDLHFTWDGDGLYETLTELGRPYPVILPIVPVASGGFATLDLVTHQGVTVSFELTVGSEDVLRIGPEQGAAVRAAR